VGHHSQVAGSRKAVARHTAAVDKEDRVNTYDIWTNVCKCFRFQAGHDLDAKFSLS